MILHPIRVTITVDGTDPVFDAWTTGDHWNGFECPQFTKGEADRVAAWSNDLAAKYPDGADGITYVAEMDAYRMDSPDWGDGYDHVEGTYNAQVGESLYPIGAYNWTWERAD